MFRCHSCDYQTDIKYNYERHKNSSKHKKLSEILNSNKNEKTNYNAQNFNETTKVNKTTKAIKAIKSNEKPKNREESKDTRECQDCGKVFKHYSSYHRHRKYRCDTKEEEKDDLLKLKHQLELLQQRIEYQDTISNLERQNVELEKNLTIQSYQEKLDYLEKSQNHSKNLTQNTVNISNPSIVTKQNTLNVHFGEMIDLDTFIENYKTKYPLTYDETKVLLENYHHSGIKSYGAGLFSLLKKNCSKQLSELIGEDIETPILPFVLSDSGLRKHLEKTPEGWIPASTRDKIKKLVVISNDQIYKYHNDMIPLSAYEKELITNSILRKSDYHYAQLAIQKQSHAGNDQLNCLRNLPELPDIDLNNLPEIIIQEPDLELN